MNGHFDQSDTIAAIATASGAGGIAIVRISGEKAAEILEKMFIPARARDRFESHRLMYGRAVDDNGGTLDEVMAVMMRAPATYTRQDVAEIHCHGGAVSANAVLGRALALGARTAMPGEFTRASLRQLEGGVSGFVKRISDRLTDIMALLEASTDFPEEVEEEVAAEQVVEGLKAVIREIRDRGDARSARLIREGASIVLAGRPNVGKSSLMNALLDQERAIVTDIPGTTRDVLTERISIGGVVAEISDTAGRRTAEDPIERIGVDRAERAAEGADVVLIVLDAAEDLDEEGAALVKAADERSVICLNKGDLEVRTTSEQLRGLTGAKILEISARTGAGLQALKEELSRRLSAGEECDGRLTARRHIELADSAAKHLEQAVEAVGDGLPLDTAAVDIRAALSDLSEITGENAAESVIDRVFENFCVGK